MARTQATIINQINNYLTNSAPLLSGLNLLLPNAVFKSVINVIAWGVYNFELLTDGYKSSIELQVKNYNGSREYLLAKIFAYQFGYVPTISENGSVTYDTIDTTAQIISSASVINTGNPVTGFIGGGNANIRVATGNPPVSLSVDQLSDFSGYINLFLPQMMNNTVTTNNSDAITIIASITFDKNYQEVIHATVFAAITNYLMNISNGTFNTATLIYNIKSVPGVQTIYIDTIKIRTSLQAWAAGTILYKHEPSVVAVGSLDASWIATNSAIIEETTPTYDWGTTITFS